MAKKPNPKWEYGYLGDTPGEHLMKRLTEESASGWEPIAFAAHVYKGQPMLHIVMRRAWGEQDKPKDMKIRTYRYKEGEKS